MKKLYYFGFITGWIILLIVSFFIFSMIAFIEKLRIIDITFCVLVIVMGIKYFIEYTLFPYNYYIKEDIVFIYRKKRLCYQISRDKIKGDNGLFKPIKKLSFEIDKLIRELSVDYDNELCNANNDKNYRILWYIIYIIIILMILVSLIYYFINKL